MSPFFSDKLAAISVIFLNATNKGRIKNHFILLMLYNYILKSTLILILAESDKPADSDKIDEFRSLSAKSDESELVDIENRTQRIECEKPNIGI